MKQLVMPLLRLLRQVLLLLLLFFISRTAFTIINARHFSGLDISGFFRLAFFATRYDLAAICAINGLYILLLFLPVPIWRFPLWENITQWIFIITNSLAFLFELSDWAYFPYNFKRATADVLKLVTRQGDFWSVLPDYIVSYWYVPLVATVWVYVLIRLNDRIRRATPLNGAPEFGHLWLMSFWQIVLLIIACSATVIGVRGGLQYIPIGLRNAVQVTESKYIPVVVNTPFSIISTLAAPALEEVVYMDPAEAHQIMPFRHQYTGKAFNRKNVVVIILESASKEFTAYGNGISYTPFLDSLMGKGLACTQAFANGQTSAEGIPAIIAGIPTLMDEAFTTSNYGTNRITTLPGVLKGEGYASAFYHGGTNGTMSFDIFSDAAGYDRYFGRDQYAHEADYDGAWGIRDEPFMQYFATRLSRMQRPFFASVFTLSAHPPYSLPEQYRSTLPSGSLPVHQCIAYTDLALRKFFATASLQGWYDSTLFVITADHCSPATTGDFYAQGLGRYAIPLLFYAPGDSSFRGLIDQPVQQLDILPSVLHYLGYSKPFFAFGNSFFSPREPRYVVTYNSNAYQWLQDGDLLQTTGMVPTGFYAYPADSISRDNLLQSSLEEKDRKLKQLKAFVQQYNYALIHNSMQ